MTIILLNLIAQRIEKKGNGGVNDDVTFRGQNNTNGVETRIYYCFCRKHKYVYGNTSYVL